MRKTKIVCTLGPACDDEKTLIAMCKAGMNVARFNFSHGTHEEHLKRINMIKSIRKKLNMPIAILLDTKGPEFRIKTFKDGKVDLKEGQKFTFTTRNVEGDDTIVAVNYSNLTSDIGEGDTILLNNGLLNFKVKKIEGTEIYTEVVIGGELSNRKSMSFPGKQLSQPYLSEQDKDDILFGIQNGIDFIACSFVSRRQDLEDIIAFKDSHGGEDVDLIAKIENRAGVENIEDICKACDGIMVARGDMGVELPFEELPAIQKKLITKCRLLGKRVITATEMLESMIYNPRPTRAEISDVANAVYDGTSAIMLSGETANGKYPVKSIETMASIAEYTESTIHYTKRFFSAEFIIQNLVDAISHSTCAMAIDIDAKVIAVCSISGKTARMVSRFRSPVDILGFTTNERTLYKLALSWGVTPALTQKYDSIDVLFYTAKQTAIKTFNLKADDRIIITGGMTNGESGNTNILKVETV